MEIKKFILPASAIQPLVAGSGSCIASDMITVYGYQVGYMYREKPMSDLDSGWRFFSGNETQAYVNNPDNLMMYDINTIANYDQAIIPYLEMAIGTELQRVGLDEFESI